MKLVALLALSAGLAAAQAPGEPFSLVRIVQNESGPGLDPTPIDSYRAAQSPVDIIGLRSVTGSSQLWLLEAHASFAGIENLDNALSGRASRPDPSAPLPVSNTIIGIYRPALSHRPEEAVKMFPQARYFRIAVYRIRPGFEVEFGDLMNWRRAGMERVNLDRPEIGYQIVSGSTSGTYVFVSPLPSLSVLDNAYPGQGAPRPAAPTRPASDALLSREQLLFRVEPAASYVSPAFAGSNAAFWHPGSGTK